VIRNYSLRIRDAKPEDSGVYDLLLSNQAGRASAQLHLLVSTPPLLSKVNQTIAANESSVLFIDCLQPGDSVSPPPATEFSWYRLDPGGGNPSLVATSGTAGADSSGSRILQLPPQQASVHAENGRLIIHNLSVDASGQYVCLAVTRLSEPGAILEQQDKEFARNTSGTVRLRVIPALRLCPNLANTVFVELKTQHVIDCPWSGLEQPSIAWYRLYPNGRRRRLPTSVGVELSKNNTRLTIHMSDPEFSGRPTAPARDSHQALLHRGGPPAGVRPHQPEPHGDPRRLGVAALPRLGKPAAADLLDAAPARQERGRHLRPHELEAGAERQPEGRAVRERQPAESTGCRRWTPETTTAWLAANSESP
uniref:Ig-like domain-containing protein n=1 Tax=Macrostomum lignano TaxID=282301 RepID=A0A1I8IKV2_9PLAT